MRDAELNNKSNNDKAPNYWREKALHEKGKRELAELDLKHDQLIEVDQVGHHTDRIFYAVRQRLLATPSKIAPLVHADALYCPHVVPLSPRFPHLISGCLNKRSHVKSPQHRMLKMLD